MFRVVTRSVLPEQPGRTPAKIAVVAASVLAFGALVGWSFDIPGMRDLLHGTTPMFPIAAMGILASSIAWLLIENDASRWGRIVAIVLAVSVLTTGVAELSEYLFHVSLGIDQGLFRHALESQPIPKAGRIPPNTAFNFILLGVALLLSLKRQEKRTRIPELLAMIVGATALVGLCGYIYAVPSLYSISHHTAMSFSTSAAFILLCSAMLATHTALRREFRILLGVMLLLLVVGVNAVASMRATQNLMEKNRWVEHTRIVTGELEAVRAALSGMEAGERGYLYTNKPQYLESYQLRKSKLNDHMNRLATLITDNPVQQRSLARLHLSVQDATNLFQQAIALEAAGQYRTAKQLVLTGTGKQKMDEVGALLEEMQSEESRLLASRLAQAQLSERYLLLTIPASHAFTALLVVIAGLLVSRALRKSVETARTFRELAQREQAASAWLRKTQDALVRSEKLAIVGRMAATVAHEINNPLEAVTNLIWIAKNDPTASENVKKRLGIADDELRRVAQITKQTLGFYRDTGQEGLIKVSEVMDSVLGLYGSRLRSKEISVRTQYAECYVFGHAGELRQLFSNLCANAIDAIPVHGTLSVKASRSQHWGTGDQAGVRVTIADDGCGIRTDHLNRLFEPFFSTKESTGTGLGLWVAKQIAEKHKGRIAVRSKTNPGTHYTVFSVFLPDRGEARAQEIKVAS